MTKREFDATTKINHGGRGFIGSWVDREEYRRARKIDGSRAPLLERRASYLASRGMSPLWIGSPFRGPALWNARHALVL